jgi:Domain of unknown function (DUF6434)/SAP domain-containing new25
MARPHVSDIKTGAEFKRWYWLKEELVTYCKLTNIPYGGQKFDILERIAQHLDNDSSVEKPKTAQPKSKFDWHSAPLNLDTIITDSYKNSANVRRFFQTHCDPKFSFNIAFMAWMKQNVGKTLQDAVSEWQRLKVQTKDKNFKTDIPIGNQYNQYMRDFFQDNPTKTLKEARRFWELKRALPLQFHKYERRDLDLR